MTPSIYIYDVEFDVIYGGYCETCEYTSMGIKYKVKDSLGRRLSAGCDVIYNHSGYLAKGRLEKIVEGPRYTVFHIRHLEGGYTYRIPKSGVSKVRDGKNIVRI